MWLNSFLVVALLAPALSSAQNLRTSWDIELDDANAPNSCAPYAEKLINAYNEAAEIVVKGRTDLMSGDRTRPGPANSPQAENWDRIVRAMNTFFGFGPHTNGNVDQQHLSDVRYVFDRMARLFQGSVNPLPRGLRDRYRPAIACGDRGWAFKRADGPSPSDPQRTLAETHPQYASTGAWFWKERLFYSKSRSTQQSVGICRTGTYGVTFERLDLIVFCPPLLDINPVPLKTIKDTGAVEPADRLDDYTSEAQSPTIIHEFAHYFGSRGFTDGNQEIQPVLDQQAVDFMGRLQYQTAAGDIVLDRQTNGRNNDRVPVYNFQRLQNLARIHQGANAGNSGPDKSIFTAEAYAYFSIVSYFDEFDWSENGRAGNQDSDDDDDDDDDDDMDDDDDDDDDDDMDGDSPSERSLNAGLIAVPFTA